MTISQNGNENFCEVEILLIRPNVKYVLEDGKKCWEKCFQNKKFWKLFIEHNIFQWSYLSMKFGENINQTKCCSQMSYILTNT